MKAYENYFSLSALIFVRPKAYGHGPKRRLRGAFFRTVFASIREVSIQIALSTHQFTGIRQLGNKCIRPECVQTVFLHIDLFITYR
jgi:hypothetical protein